MSRLKDFYEAQIVPEMTKKFSYTNTGCSQTGKDHHQHGRWRSKRKR